MNKLSLFQSLANTEDKNSFSNKRRKWRMKVFEEYFSDILKNEHVKILDVGGTENYWKQMGYANKGNIHITIVNIKPFAITSANMLSVTGDACDLSQYVDKSFDIAFSNSVIEHVGDFERQNKMAKEIVRVSKMGFIQTPNFWFPFEPHFLLIGFHWMPLCFRTLLVRHFNIGWQKKQCDKEKAKSAANRIHLLSKSKLKKLFPDAKIVNEFFWGLVKSYIVLYREYCGV